MTMNCEEFQSPMQTEWDSLVSHPFGDGIYNLDTLEYDNYLNPSSYSQISYRQSVVGDAVTRPDFVRSIERDLSAHDIRQSYIPDGSACDVMRSPQTDGESPPSTDAANTSSQRAGSGGGDNVTSPSSRSGHDKHHGPPSQPSDTTQTRRRHEKIIGHYKCTFTNCNVAKDRQSDLNKHIKAVHEDKIFVCPECDKGFAYDKDLQRHTPTHKKSSTGSDFNDDGSSSCRAISPVSSCSTNRKRVDSPAWIQEQSLDSKRSRKSELGLRHDSPMEAAAATLNAEVSVHRGDYRRIRDLPARRISAIPSEGAQSSIRQHIEALRIHFDLQSSQHTYPSHQLGLPQKLEFGAVCKDTIIVASGDLLKSLSSRYNQDSQFKLRMPAGPSHQRQKFLGELQRSLSNYATRSKTNIVFVGIDPRSGTTGLIEAKCSSNLLSTLIEACSIADTEGLAVRTWDTLNVCLQSCLDDADSEFAKNCRVAWT